MLFVSAAAVGSLVFDDPPQLPTPNSIIMLRVALPAVPCNRLLKAVPVFAWLAPRRLPARIQPCAFTLPRFPWGFCVPWAARHSRDPCFDAVMCCSEEVAPSSNDDPMATDAACLD